jgi:cell division protein FtsL|tara:strand:- start:437 stop:637 length:201 start_codon:yes stop_codon:yes gene_type:complete
MVMKLYQIQQLMTDLDEIASGQSTEANELSSVVTALEANQLVARIKTLELSRRDQKAETDDESIPL